MRWRGASSAIGVLLAIIVLSSVLWVSVWPPCSGARECYALWRGVTEGNGPLERARERFIAQFAASSDLLIFPTPAENGVALVVFNRTDKTPRLLVEPGATFDFPFLSRDKKRLLFSRHRNGASDREIISCDVTDWVCKIAINVQGTVFSPAELSHDEIVYVSSPKIVGQDGKSRYSKNDVFLAQNGKSSRITDLGFYEMDSLSVTQDHLYVSGIQRDADEVIRFDRAKLAETLPLAPSQFISAQDLRVSNVIAEPLNKVSVSHDGQLIAFRHAESARGGYRYNLNVMNLDKRLLGVARVTGINGRAMSQGQFIGSTLLSNELFADQYVAKSWDIANNRFETIAEIGHSSKALQDFAKIAWKLAASQ